MSERQIDLVWIGEQYPTAPYTGDLEVAVIDKDGRHTVAFACRRVVGGWIAAETKQTDQGKADVLASVAIASRKNLEAVSKGLSD